MEIKEGYVSFLNYKTYYRIVNPNGKKTPLLMLHGGPGSTHNSFELFDNLAYEDDRPIIMYDQIGCGKSVIEENHKELWKKETWTAELDNLRNQLGLKEVHLFGHSWGGMLEIIYMCDCNPKGIKSLTLSSTLSSVELWRAETHRLLKFLPENIRNILTESEKNNDFESEEVKKAYDVYYHSYIFGPFDENAPECLRRKKPSSKESYMTAWGPSEFSPSGTLVDYEYTDKLENIKTPVLICNGGEDESTPFQNKVMYENIGSEDKKWILYQFSRHMTYYDEHDLYLKNLKEFLDNHD